MNSSYAWNYLLIPGYLISDKGLEDMLRLVQGVMLELAGEASTPELAQLVPKLRQELAKRKELVR